MSEFGAINSFFQSILGTSNIESSATHIAMKGDDNDGVKKKLLDRQIHDALNGANSSPPCNVNNGFETYA